MNNNWWCLLAFLWSVGFMLGGFIDRREAQILERLDVYLQKQEAIIP